MLELKRYIEPEKPAARTTKATVNRESPEFLGKGLSEGTVHRVGVTVVGEHGNTRDVKMAEKVLDRLDLSDDDKGSIIDHVLYVHAHLRELGLPTIPTMRQEVGNNTSIFMTDLTQNDKKEVVSLPDWDQTDDRENEKEKRKGKFAEIDHKIEISNCAELAESIAALFDQTIAAGCGLDLPDVFFIIVDKESREGQVILGDLLQVSIEDLPLDSLWQRLLIEKNFAIFSKFIIGMKNHIKDSEGLSVEPLKKVRQKYLEKLK